MPQFEIFSFSSQMTWVFLFFSLIYSVFCYSFCPMIVSIFKIRNIQLYFCSNFSSVSLDNTLIIKVPTIIGSKKYELSKHVKSNVTNYFINLNFVCYTNLLVRNYLLHNFF